MDPVLATSIIACLGALTAYIKAHTENSSIRHDREETKKERDSREDMLAYRLSQAEKRLDLNDPKLDRIMDMLADIKADLARTSVMAKEKK